jgi:hypothetical protein
VVLVEGASDRLALERLARRLGRDLTAEGVELVDMGGATNVGHHLDGLDSTAGVLLAGLCDAREAPVVHRALVRRGVADAEDGLEAAGFFVCVDDLEDELIRAVGVDRVLEVLDAEGDLRSYRIFEQQPAQQDRPEHRRLRRFLGTRSGRKAHYAEVLVDALDLAQIPEPLAAVLARVAP